MRRICVSWANALARAVRTALGRARSTADKRRQRGLPQEVPLDAEVEDRTSSGVVEVGLILDLRALLETFTPDERLIWQRSAEGATLRAIGAEIGLPFQRVGEVRRRLLRRVGACLDGRLP